MNLLDISNNIKKLFGNAGQQINNVGNYFNPTSNNGQNFWSTPYAKGLATEQQAIQNFANKTPVTIAPQIKNPVFRFVAGVPEGMINAPQVSAQGAVEFGTNARQGTLTPQNVLSSTAKMADLPLTLATLGGGEKVAEGIGKQSLKDILLAGAKGGAKYGSMFGAVGGLQNLNNQDTLLSGAGKVAESTALGTVAGAVLGTGMAGLGFAANLGMKHLPDANQIPAGLGIKDINIMSDKEYVKTFDVKNPVTKVDNAGVFSETQAKNFLDDMTKTYNYYDKAASANDRLGNTDTANYIRTKVLPDVQESIVILNDRLGHVGESPQITAQTSPLSPTETGVTTQAQNGVSPITPEAKLAVMGYTQKDVAKLSPQEIQDAVKNNTLPFMNEKINPTVEANTETPTNLSKGENPLGPQAENPSQPSIPLKESAKNALTEYSGNKQLVEQNAKAAAELANSGVKGEQETRLFRNSIEHPENLTQNLNQVKDPTKFSQAVDAYKQFTDNLFNIYNKTATDKVGFLEDYYSHIIDTSDPAKAQALKDWIATKNPQGWFTKNRIFKNIDELESAGFTLKNKSVAADILGYGRSLARSSSSNAFIQEIMKDYPKEISVGVKPVGFKQIQWPGLEDTYVSPELYKEVKNSFSPNNLMENKAVQVAAKANELDKSIKLAAGGFHALKTTIRAATLTPESIPGALWDMVNPEARTATLKAAIDDGTVENAGKLGVTLGGGDVVNADSSLAQQISSKNPIQQLNDSLFGGLIRRYKLDLVRKIAGDYDLNDPAQLKEARGIGEQVNNWFGGLNYTVLNRNKEFQTAIKFLGLAPDFNEGKLRNLFSSVNVTDWSPGNNFARKALIGEAVTVGVLSYLSRALMQGKFDTNFKSIVQNNIIDPNIPLPSMFNNPQTGKTQTAHLPGSSITDISKLFTDPGQFVQARGAAGPALLTRLQTNKDYYGQTINQPGTPTGQAAWNLLKTDLPIPVVQGMKAASGKESVPSAIVNTIGLRTGNDPNDPAQVQQTAYYNNITQGQKQLGFDDNDMAQWNTVHPTKKDLDGNIIFSPGAANTAKNALLYLNNPKLQQLEVSVAQNTPGGHDPIWDLTPDARNMILASQAKLPGQTNNFGKELSKTNWYTPFLTARDAFFANLSAQPQTPYQQQQTAQVKAASSTGPLTAPPQSLYDTNKTEYFKELDAYNNQKLTALGLPALAGAGYGGYGPKKITVKKSTIKMPKVGVVKLTAMKLPKMPTFKVKKAKAPKISAGKSKVKIYKVKASKIRLINPKKRGGIVNLVA